MLALRDLTPARAYRVLGMTAHGHLDAAHSGAALSLFTLDVPPGAGPPLHVHTREEETVLVLEGTFEVQRGDERAMLVAGQAALLPREVPHRWRNAGEEPARLLVAFTPGGLESMFAGWDALAQEGTASPAAMAEVAAQHGVTILPAG